MRTSLLHCIRPLIAASGILYLSASIVSAQSHRPEHIGMDETIIFNEQVWPLVSMPDNAQDGDRYKLLVKDGFYIWQYHSEQWHNDTLDEQRQSLIYILGSVERVIKGTALIDLGEIHTLKRENAVAIFRSSAGHFRPLGTMTISEAYPTHCQTHQSHKVVPEPGDIVLCHPWMLHSGSLPTNV